MVQAFPLPKSRSPSQQFRLVVAGAAVVTCVVGFSLLSHFWLSRLPLSPRTNLGWQHGEASFLLSTPQRPISPSRPPEGPQDDVPPELLDFRFPNVYDPELLNPIPLTDIALKSCIFPPSIWDVCMVDETYGPFDLPSFAQSSC
jgi:hypothetical protein